MQLSEFWAIFLKTTQYGSAVTSVTLNTILITLIILRSPKSLGIYKYLMIYIALFEALYSILDVIAEPSIISYRAAFIVFRDFKHSMFGRSQSFLLIVIYCGCFGFSLAIFGVHFFYRYAAVDGKFRRRYLWGNNVYILFLVPIVYGTWWAAITGEYFHQTENTNLYIRNALLDNYDLRVEDISYAVVLFYPPNRHPATDSPILFPITCIWFMILSSLFCVMYFGVKCYLKLSRELGATGMSSKVSESLQQQLFQALVSQTTIPAILMYIPCAALLCFPMLKVDVGFPGSFVAATVALYPAIDPLPTMFIIKNYRRTLFCKTRCCFKQSPVQHATAVQQTSPVI